MSRNFSITFDPDDYYPAGKIYDYFEGILGGDSYWDSNMNRCLDHLKNKLDSSRIQNLDEIWYSGFEDLELRKLERSLFAIRVIVNDIKREEKELELWRIQHRHLKNILCEVDDILDDMALRSPQLKQVLQSHLVSPHPYVTAKLVDLNNLILELDAIAAEIKSEVLPGFYTRKKPTAHSFQSNQSMPMTSHTPSVDERNEFTGWKNNGHGADSSKIQLQKLTSRVNWLIETACSHNRVERANYTMLSALCTHFQLGVQPDVLPQFVEPPAITDEESVVEESSEEDDGSDDAIKSDEDSLE